METYKLFVNQSQTRLVRVWEDGTVEVCERSSVLGVWGPPEILHKVED